LDAAFGADEPVQVHRMKRWLVRELQPEHDHPRHPEEQDVVARLHDGGRIEHAQVARVFGPAERAEGPETGGKPRVQDIRILMELRAVARWAALWLVDAGPLVPASRCVTVVNRYAVAPP